MLQWKMTFCFVLMMEDGVAIRLNYLTIRLFQGTNRLSPSPTLIWIMMQEVFNSEI